MRSNIQVKKPKADRTLDVMLTQRKKEREKSSLTDNERERERHSQRKRQRVRRTH